MLLRTYQADSLEQALALVKAELGDEATIVSSRRVRASMLAPSKLEVTATLPAASPMTKRLERAQKDQEREEAPMAPRPDVPAPAAAPALMVPQVDARYVARAMMPLRKDLRRLREDLARIFEQVEQQQQPAVEAVRLEAALRELLKLSEGEGEGALPRLQERLERAGTSPRGALEIARAVASQLAGDDQTSDAPLEHLAAAVVQQRLRCQPPLDEGRSAGQRVAVVGPAGVGKTTTLAKIAARAALVHQRSVAVVGFDNERIGASESVKALAQTIGLPYRLAKSGVQLGHALATFSEKSLILIDTTGYSPRRQRELGGLGEVLARHGCEAHLVLSTELREMELDGALEAFALVRPKTLSVSKIDQTIGLGGIYDATTRSKLPLMYLCNGRRVPEDIEPATASKTASLILGLQYN